MLFKQLNRKLDKKLDRNLRYNLNERTYSRVEDKSSLNVAKNGVLRKLAYKLKK